LSHLTVQLMVGRPVGLSLCRKLLPQCEVI